jgi:DNA-binding PadR family transcriptional regulator
MDYSKRTMMTEPIPRLTPLAMLALGLLTERPMHPYEMLRVLRARGEDRLVPLSNGTFYHAVSRLAASGLAVEEAVGRDGNRPERTTYAITDAGRAASQDWVRRELPRIDHSLEFRVALSEAHDLPREEVVELLDRRRRTLEERRASLADAVARADGRGVPLQFLLDADRDLVLLDTDLRWHDDVRARLLDPSIPWGIDEVPAQTRERLTAHREAAAR